MSVSAMEMALAIERRPDGESLEAFVRRTFAQERMSTLSEALEICIKRDRIMGEFDALLDALRCVEDANTLIDVLIERRRAKGYDAEFEAIVVRQWLCPHCGFRGTIADALLPIGAPELMPACRVCKREGIEPIDSDDPPALKVVDGGKRAVGSRSGGRLL